MSTSHLTCHFEMLCGRTSGNEEYVKIDFSSSCIVGIHNWQEHAKGLLINGNCQKSGSDFTNNFDVNIHSQF